MGAPLLWPSDLMQKPVLQQQHLQAPAVLGETAGTAWLVFMACSPVCPTQSLLRSSQQSFAGEASLRQRCLKAQTP